MSAADAACACAGSWASPPRGFEVGTNRKIVGGGSPSDSEDSMPRGVGDGFEATVDVELGEEVLDVIAHGGRAHVQALGRAARGPASAAPCQRSRPGTGG